MDQRVDGDNLKHTHAAIPRENNAPPHPLWFVTWCQQIPPLTAFVLFGCVSFCECNVSSVAVSPLPPPPSPRVSAAAPIQCKITTFQDQFTETLKILKKINELLFAVGMFSACALACVFIDVILSLPIVFCNLTLNRKKKKKTSIWLKKK